LVTSVVSDSWHYLNLSASLHLVPLLNHNADRHQHHLLI